MVCGYFTHYYIEESLIRDSLKKNCYLLRRENIIGNRIFNPTSLIFLFVANETANNKNHVKKLGQFFCIILRAIIFVALKPKCHNYFWFPC